MQSVTLEVPTAALTPLGLVPPGFFDRFEELELMETLGLQPRWRLQVVRLRTRGPVRSAAELARRARRLKAAYGLESFELLESRAESRDHFLLVRQRNPGPVQGILEVAGGEVFPGHPFLLRPSTSLASLRGERAPLRRVLRRLAVLGVPFRLRTVRPGAGGSPLAVGPDLLSPAQGALLALALRRGYYEVPRRVTLTQLARGSGRSASAAGKMLRRGERALARHYLGLDAATPAPARAPEI